MRIADTGLLKAFLDRRDQHHRWSVRAWESLTGPWVTCEACLVETAALLGSAVLVGRLAANGDVIVAFNYQDNARRVAALLAKYSDRPMDLADACLVCLSELNPGAKLWTVDVADFRIYRRQDGKPVPCSFPD